MCRSSAFARATACGSTVSWRSRAAAAAPRSSGCTASGRCSPPGGPVSDIAGEAKHLGARELRRRVAAAERIARRDPQALVPRAWGFWSARRYISLYRPGQDEDVFPYDRPSARWTTLRSVRLPIAAIIGSRDEYLDRPPQEVIDAFRRNAVRARSFSGVVLRGARHGFQKRERELADVIVRWVRNPRATIS